MESAWVSLIAHLPLLLIGVPICGLLSLMPSRWWGQPSVPRIVLVNGLLSLSMVLLILSTFDHGHWRSRLDPSESFQFLNRLVLSNSTDTSFRFGIDGFSLIPLLIIAMLPLWVSLVPWVNGSSHERTFCVPTPLWTFGRAAVLLCLQLLLLICVLTLDRRVQLVTLILISFSLHLLFALSMPRAVRRSLNRRMRQLLLSDFLIAGGMLFSLMPLQRHLDLDIQGSTIWDIPTLLTALETLRFETPVTHEYLIRSLSAGLSAIVLGGLLRFGTFPLMRDSRRMWRETTPFHRLVFWVTGPVLGSLMLYRELQLYPWLVSKILSIASWVLIGGLLWLGWRRGGIDDPQDDSADLVFLSTLLALSLCGSNVTSLAASLMLLVGTACSLVVTRTPPRNRIDVSLLSCWRILANSLIGFGMALTLLGIWQGAGLGFRNLFFSCLTGLALILWLLGRRVLEKPSDVLKTTWLVDRQNLVGLKSKSGEWPSWNLPRSTSDATVVSPQSLTTTVLLILGCLFIVCLPQLIWQTVRWDFQKLEFPVPTRGVTASEVDR